jgi:hypothetical protein
LDVNLEFLHYYPARIRMEDKGLNPEKNSNVIGKMKDESPMSPIQEFIGLRPKMYAYQTLETEGDEQKLETHMKGKGIPSHVLRANHDIDSYRTCLQADEDYIVKRTIITGIHSKRHELRTDIITKQTLSPLDSKRWMENTVKTLPFGHYSIPDMEHWMQHCLHTMHLPESETEMEIDSELEFLDLDGDLVPAPRLVGVKRTRTTEY